MQRICLMAAALLLVVTPAVAQSTSGSTGTPTPSAPNSGAGVQGVPGNKSGPARRAGDSTTTTDQRGSATSSQQDASKIQGMPGSKSGPAARTPNPK
jgi:hypothetical protein